MLKNYKKMVIMKQEIKLMKKRLKNSFAIDLALARAHVIDGDGEDRVVVDVADLAVGVQDALRGGTAPRGEHAAVHHLE